MLASYAVYRDKANKKVDDNIYLKNPAEFKQEDIKPIDPSAFLSTSVLKSMPRKSDLVNALRVIPNNKIPPKRYLVIDRSGRTRVLFHPSPSTSLPITDPNSPYVFIFS